LQIAVTLSRIDTQFINAFPKSRMIKLRRFGCLEAKLFTPPTFGLFL
jgi:hypothetical protein